MAYVAVYASDTQRLNGNKSEELAACASGHRTLLQHRNGRDLYGFNWLVVVVIQQFRAILHGRRAPFAEDDVSVTL